MIATGGYLCQAGKGWGKREANPVLADRARKIQS